MTDDQSKCFWNNFRVFRAHVRDMPEADRRKAAAVLRAGPFMVGLCAAVELSKFQNMQSALPHSNMQKMHNTHPANDEQKNDR